MPANLFTNAVRYLDQVGITDVIIPFILIFTVVFVALERAGVFRWSTSGGGNSNSRRYSSVVAFALALGVVISHVTRNFTLTRGYDVVTVINNAIPRVSVVLIAILFFLILIGVFGYEAPTGGSNFGGVIAVIALLIVGYIFFASAGFLPRGPGTILYQLGPDTTALIVVLLVFGAIVYFITSEPNTGDGSGGNWFTNSLKGLTRGGGNTGGG